ncbi:hypothetical protein ES702_00267 [subsurface metagenome]
MISPRTDATLDKKTPTNGEVQPAIPAVDDVSMQDADASTNGIKRKARESNTRPTYAESESSDDDLPLVCISLDCAFLNSR